MRHRSRVPRLVSVASLLLIIAARVDGQSLSGRAMRAGVGVEGAVVLLFDEHGGTRARTITRESGRFNITAPAPGKYSARVLRIGFAPTTAGPFVLRAGEATNADIELTGRAITLDRVTVTSRSECRVRPDSAATAFQAWEAARTALFATSLTKAEALSMVVSQTQRTLDRDGSRVLAESTVTERGRSVNPFVSLPPDSAAKYGFVTSSRDGRTFWGPDAEILLSESFATTHCLRLESQPAAAALLGVAFAPAATHRDFVDVEGVVWLDRQTAELRALDYRYVNLPLAERARAGGRIDFRRLPAGWWVVERWSIRYPVIATRSGGRDAPVLPGVARSAQTTEELAGVRLASGEISEVRRGSTVLWERGRASLRVRAVDDVTGAPVAGVLVGEAASGSATATGPDGVLRLDRLLPGTVTLSVRAPELEAFGEEPMLIPVRVAAEEAEIVAIPIPSVRRLLVERCGARAVEWGEGIVRGRVDSTAARAPVTIRWRTPYARLGGGAPVFVEERREVTPDTAGRFDACVPRDAEVAIDASGASGLPARAPMRFPPNALALRWPPR